MHEVEDRGPRPPVWGLRLLAELVAARRVLVGAVVVMDVLAVLQVLTTEPGNQGDLAVYQEAGRTVLNHGLLYADTLVNDLWFTYTPFASLAFTPLALVPYPVASLLFTALLIVAPLPLCLLTVFRALGLDRWAWLLTGIVFAPALLCLQPVRDTLGYGQINMVLMALVLVDCLAERPWWPRGLLVGIAAAIKLTPVAFLLFFLLNRDRRAALVAGLTFVAGAIAAYLARPADSMSYWTSAIFRTDHIGPLGIRINQSLRGTIARPGTGLTWLDSTVWLVACIAVLVVAVLGMRRVLAQGQPARAVVLNAFAALLVSPISWSHHWVWFAPAIVVHAVLGLRTGDRTMLRLAPAGALVAMAPSIDAITGRFLLVSPFVVYAGVTLVLAARLGRARDDALSRGGERVAG
ncbi:glycosyltransferase 87 family protein [Amycolatopsis thermalba]|uniref:Glycosyltransferase 87 family protein n=1 Tax=Amycolatopsis thermalba TaxID=944492 RepID=A0ABY4NP26_9PSEU|nr:MULTISPECIES: glycosyltransferase 87 family protein [Amycolatopsis]UQS21530.1 glycosyltransferase 87 family protein [Amycolatopsis thermalba]